MAAVAMTTVAPCAVKMAVAAPARPAARPALRPVVGFKSHSICQVASADDKFAELRMATRVNTRASALTTKNNLGEEIFKIVPVMSAITLVGLAFGFLLLRAEALTEEEE